MTFAGTSPEQVVERDRPPPEGKEDVIRPPLHVRFRSRRFGDADPTFPVANGSRDAGGEGASDERNEYADDGDNVPLLIGPVAALPDDWRAERAVLQYMEYTLILLDLNIHCLPPPKPASV